MKVYLDTIGCRLNQSEIERMANQFRKAGHVIVGSPEGADLVVVNTCTVTAKAAADSRKQIRHAWRAGAAKVVATGCWATLDPAGAAELPGVSRVIANDHKDELVAEVLGVPALELDLSGMIREPLPGNHMRTRAFIKVQDGCDNHCTFCITRIARGKSRSRTIEDVLQDVRAAAAGGTKEVVLTGVQIGSWGKDFENPVHLKTLLSTILERTDIPRLRLSSLEPWDLDQDFFSLWKDRRLCRHLHLPLQSGSKVVLQRMARKTTPEKYAELVSMARSVSPDIAITTDIIAGFPGESGENFKESLKFVEEISFAAGHVFTYSPRPGTPASSYPEQVPSLEKKARNAAYRAVLERTSHQYQQRFIGETLPVLWESAHLNGSDSMNLKGLTDNYLRVSSAGAETLWNQISKVRLEEFSDHGMVGTIVSRG